MQNPQIIPTEKGLLNITNKDVSKYLKLTKTKDEVNIVFFGTPEFAAIILEKLINFCQNSPQTLTVKSRIGNVKFLKFNVKTVVTAPDKPIGRKQILTTSLVSQVAQKYNIITLKPAILNHDFIRNHSHLLDSDLFIVAAYGRILPFSLLNIPKLGSINVHPSILPKYRGASPIQAAILNGDKKTGVSLMLMDEELDHGPILATGKISISNQDNYQILSTKLALLGADLLIKTLPDFIEGKLKPRLQDHAIAEYCNLVKKQDGYFDLPAGRQVLTPQFSEKLDRMVRAYYPWPTAWTLFRASSADLRSAEGSCKARAAAKAGQGSRGQARVVKLLPEGKIQMEGKKPTDLKSFLNGYPDFPLKDFSW